MHRHFITARLRPRDFQVPPSTSLRRDASLDAQTAKMTRHKRSRDEYERRSGFATGTASQPRDGDERTQSPGLPGPGDDVVKLPDDESALAPAHEPDEWTLVESHSSKKRKKMPQKDGGNYPSITHSPHARLQSFVKINDLQNLALYLLADGTAPQWCSVRHHANIRKVVVLMVPGLDNGMFDGSIVLDQQEGTSKPAQNVQMGSPIDGVSKGSGTFGNANHDNNDKPISSLESTARGRSADSSELAHASISTSSVPSDLPTPSRAPRRRLYISPDDYYPTKIDPSRLPTSLHPLAEIFGHVWPIRTPGDDKFARMHSPLASMLMATIPKSKEEKANKGKGPQAPAEAKGWHNKRTPVTEFLASLEELIQEEYVLHPAYSVENPAVAAREAERREEKSTTSAYGWLDNPSIAKLDDGTVPDAHIEQGSVTRGRIILAVDCEMCITSAPDIQPPVFSLTRLSVVDWDGNVVLDELVKPADPITNYLTPYSGITPQMLENVKTTLGEVQQKLLKLLTPRTVLVGHSLNSDLTALKLTHPFIIDTALLFPHPRGPPLKSSLKWLAQKYLSRTIQAGHGSTGHNSIEDARASLDLVKQKCEKGKLWGTSEASGESIFKRLSRSMRAKRFKVHPDGDDEPNVGAVVDWGEPSRGFGGQAKVAIGCTNDAHVVAGIKRAMQGDDDDSVVPRSGVDFVWARFRELEAYRGWWNKSKTLDADALREDSAAASHDASLADVVARTVIGIKEVWESLPSCTAFIVYSGSGDPRRLSELQDVKQKHKAEYQVKKWDELTVRWTDVEEQELKKACETARRGLGFIAVK